MNRRWAHFPFFLLASCMVMQSVAAQQIVGHRGASHGAPENTLAAFQLAWEEQADGVEGDFYYTKDNQIVCIHDADTQRTAGVKKAVASSTLAELRELEYGSWKGEQFRGEPIPTFAEVLQSIPAGKLFVIELKTGPQIVPLLVKELRRLQPNLDDLLIISFKADTVKACKEQLPSVRAHWLTSYKQDKRTGAFHPTAAEIAKTLNECGADGLGTNGKRAVVTAEFIAELRELGMQEFHVWTIDDGDDARYFQRLGAMGITTNRPSSIRAALAEPVSN